MVRQATNEPTMSRMAQNLRTGRHSVAGMHNRFHARIGRLDPVFHMFSAVADRQAISRDANHETWFAGLPFAVKDNFDSAGVRTRYGSRIYRDHVPNTDADIIRLARRHGAVMIGKADMAEFALFSPPRTRNPLMPDRTPGGSSSGSAAAVAAGTCAFAFGSQTAGSVVRPAAYCGVTGFKPSFGLLSTDGLKPVAPTLDTVGVFSLTPRDMCFVMSPLLGMTFENNDADLVHRLALCKGWADIELDDHVDRAFAQAILALEEGSFFISPATLPEGLVAAHHAHRVIMAYEARQSLRAEFETYCDMLSSPLRAFLTQAQLITDIEYQAACDKVSAARECLHQFFEGFDFLVTPSASSIPPAGLSSTGTSVLNRLWTAVGAPSISIPLKGRSGPQPVGLQVIGPPQSDAALLRAAVRIEEVVGVSADPRDGARAGDGGRDGERNASE